MATKELGEVETVALSQLRKLNGMMMQYQQQMLEMTLQREQISSQISKLSKEYIDLQADMNALQLEVQQKFEIKKGAPYQVMLDSGKVILHEIEEEKPASEQLSH